MDASPDGYTLSEGCCDGFFDGMKEKLAVFDGSWVGTKLSDGCNEGFSDGL